jgi:adenosylcobinamide-phosphate synthase
LFYILLGIPGAFLYRVVNTLDAEIGYKDKYPYLGKFSARLDDILNYIPSRISATLILIASILLSYNYKSAFKTMIKQHKKTESPNKGITISALSGALCVCFEKEGYYKIGVNKNELSIKTIDNSMKILKFVSFLLILFCIYLIFYF